MRRFGEKLAQHPKIQGKTLEKQAETLRVNQTTYIGWYYKDIATEVCAIHAARALGEGIEYFDGLYEKTVVAGEFGERLRELRLKHKKTRKDIAQAVGLSVSRVARWEKQDCPNLHYAHKLAEIFGISIHEILTGEKSRVLPLSDDEKEIGERIARFRTKKGYTQEELAHLVGATGSTISNYENGTVVPNLHTLNRLAGVFDCKIDDFLQSNIKTNFPEVIMRLYLREGGNLTRFANKVGVMPSTVTAWQFGGMLPSIVVAMRISAQYDIAIEEMATGRPGYLYDLISTGELQTELPKRLEHEIGRTGQKPCTWFRKNKISADALNRWRHGAPPKLECFISVCRALEITADELLSVCYWEDRQ